MLQILISIIGFIIAIGILITVHEFGHFWVARRFGIKVNRFSIGFGKPFFRWYDKLGTEYALSTLPLGGYVALYGEREGAVPESMRPMSFSHKPVLVRIAVLLAGPLFNLIFAIFAYWLMFLIGISYLAPILGHVPEHSPAYAAGLRPNYEIVSIDNQPTLSWEAVSVQLISDLGESKQVLIEARSHSTVHSNSNASANSNSNADSSLSSNSNSKANSNSTLKTYHMDLHGLDHGAGSDFLKELGLNPFDPLPAVIGGFVPGYPAAESDLKKGDQIISIEGQKIRSRSEASDVIQQNLGKTLTLTVLREGKSVDVKITPIAKKSEDGKEIGFMGVIYSTNIDVPKEYMRTLRFGPIKALEEALKRTWNYTVLTLEMVKKMFQGTVSVKNLSGPITIAEYAGRSVSIGIEYFLSFLAVISINLGVLNLLPIPILDGGHIMFCVWELITGRRVSEQVQNVGLWIGGIIILFFTLFVFYNDLSRF